jgi:multidrug resistance efflux pump
MADHFFKSFKHVYLQDKKSYLNRWLLFISGLFIACLFLPWTQNIKAKGIVTSLFQEQRPQAVNSPIPGKIIRWWVREGDFVKKGDTLIQISEIKEDYLDPNLVNRTEQQVNAKKGAISFYASKVNVTESQIQNLQNGKKLKMEQIGNKLKQLENKLGGERAELMAGINEFNLAKDQFERQQKMYEQGLVSQTQFQQRNVVFQNAQAKKTVAENRLEQTVQEIVNTKIDLRGVEQEYNEKINKAEAERLQSLGTIEVGKGEVAKLENQVSNYRIRNGMYIILAPQDGQITQAKKAGLGEVIKEGEDLMSIVPPRVNYAVEMFVRPLDLPLISKGQKVRFMFDGFPAIIFSGWPNQSYGTFGGKIVAMENSISPNGMFRVLVSEDLQDRPWPDQVKIGGGAQGIALLKNVPIWYELWRNINGFPPDYYQATSKK